MRVLVFIVFAIFLLLLLIIKFINAVSFDFHGANFVILLIIS